MWPSDEARGDFALAAGTLILLPHVLALIGQLLGLFGSGFSGLIGSLLLIVLLFAFTGLVPLLLARYRKEGASAFGLDQERGGLLNGLFVAVPAVALLVLLALMDDVGPVAALTEPLDELRGSTLDAIVSVLAHVAVFAGSVLLFTFLTAKARDGFRRTEVTQLAALRTFGMGAAAVAFVFGLLLAIGPTYELVPVALESAALVAMLLVVDRLVAAGAITSRATVLAPAIVLLFTYISLSPRGLLATARNGLLAAGVVLAIAVLVETRRYAWAAVSLLAVLVVYPTVLSPTPFGIA